MAEHRRGGHGLVVDRDDVAALEVEVDGEGGVRGFLRGYGPAPHGRVRLAARILEHAAFVRDVQEVGVHGVGRLLPPVVVHGNLAALAPRHQRLPRGEVPLPPRGDHADVGIERIGAEFETHLVVALARGAVGDSLGAGLRGDLDEPLGDERSRDARAQQVLALVDGVRAEHRVDEVRHELLRQVLNVDLLDAEGPRLLARRLHFLALADIGREGHHLRVVDLLQPSADHRSVEAAGIRQHDLHPVLPEKKRVMVQQGFARGRGDGADFGTWAWKGVWGVLS